MNPQPKPNKDHVKLSPYKYQLLKEEALERDRFCRGKGCGSYQNLTLAHIIHRGAGGKNGPGDVITNVHILCMTCHDKEERTGRKK